MFIFILRQRSNIMRVVRLSRRVFFQVVTVTALFAIFLPRWKRDKLIIIDGWVVKESDLR